MPKMTMRGGSSGEPERGFQNPFFRQDIKAMELRSKEVYRFRFLPAFADLDITDAAFKTSFVPYRDRNIEPDPTTRVEGFTPWYFVLSGYSFLGRGQKAFLSPINKFNGRPHAGLDPLVDCRNFASKHEDPSIKALTERPTNVKAQAVIPKVRSWAFFNAYLEREDGWQNYILYISQMSLDDLKKKLTVKGGRNDRIITKDWADYLYGDVTDPVTGLVATSKKARPGDNTQGIETSCIFFSKKVNSLDGTEPLVIDPTTKEGQAILAGRYAIGDEANVMKIPTYTHMLDYIVADGTIPYNIIEAACGEHANMPPEPAHARAASYSTPPPTEDAPPGSSSPQQRPAPINPAKTNGYTPPPVSTTNKAAAAKPAPSVSSAKTHAALAAQAGGSSAAPSDADRARYDELVEKFTSSAANVTPAELQELTRLAMTCQGQPEMALN